MRGGRAVPQPSPGAAGAAHAERGARRAVASRLPVVLVLAALALGAPASVNARPLEANWVLMNGRGELSNRFGSSEVVTITGTAAGGGGLIPSVDIYVVPNADWSGRGGTKLVDISNPLHVPNTATGLEVLELPIWLPYLRSGEYDVVIDTNQDGVYEEDTDQVIGGGPEAGFSVYFDGNHQSIDKQALKEEYAAPWESLAQFAKLESSMVSAFQLADSASSAAGFVEAGFELYDPSPAVDELACVTSACGVATHAVEVGLDQLGPASTVWNGVDGASPASICASALAQAKLGSGVSCQAPSDPTAPLSASDFGADQLKIAAANLNRVVAGIAADPPDPEYKQLTTYEPPATEFEPAASGEPAPQEARLANDLDEAAQRSRVLLHALERFEGAVEGGSEVWAGRQATVAGEQACALAEGLEQLGDDAAQAASAMRTSGVSGSIAARRAALEALQERLATSGMSASEEQAFAAAGWSPAEMTDLVQQFLEVPVASLPDDLTGVLEEVGAHVEAAVPALWQLGTYALDLGASAPTSQPPTASFTWQVPDPNTPRTVEFDASPSSDAEGTIVEYSWSFGDGTQASGETVEHTFSSAGTYEVTLTVNDNRGQEGSISEFVTATDSPPTASFTATPQQGRVPLEVGVDASASSDADGSIVEYRWSFGDGSEASGVTASHVYTKHGVFEISLTVTDNEGQTGTSSIPITVSGPDEPPEPQNDIMQAEPTGAIDVLANDSDPEADPLTVVAAGRPAHGTAKCSPLGACEYTAQAGYVGEDSFSYTVRDTAGNETSASVSVEVLAPAAVGSTVQAVQDSAATLEGKSVAIEVLGNDRGSQPLSVTETSEPLHGTATCAKDGHCEYDPSPGFRGEDAFEYTLEDAEGGLAKGEVHVLVAPATTGYLSTTGVRAGAQRESGKLLQGLEAGWEAAVGSTPTDLTGQELGAVAAPSLSVQLSGEQSATAASVRAAKGWSAEVLDGREVRAEPTSEALLGDALSQSFPRPLPPISQGTGGDGHVPILVGDKVFAFFHHSHPTSVTCVDRSTGELCPGYPHPLMVGSSNIIGPGAVVGSRIYVHALLTPTSVYYQSAPIGLFCWDAATDDTCGMVIVDQLPQTFEPGASAPVLVGGKIYLAGDTGKLYCVDPATNEPCAKPWLQTGLSQVSGGEYDIVAHGSRVYVSRNTGEVACLDVSAQAACPGWPAPKQFSEKWNVVNEHDAQGTADGVCVVKSGQGECVTDAEPGRTQSISGWPATDDYYEVTEEAETGKRTLVGSLGRGGLGCWDWSKMAPCEGGEYHEGWLEFDTEGISLPSAYGATWDGSCVVALGDPGQVFTVDPAGYAPCTSLKSGTEKESIDLRDQRCDGTVGEAKWLEAKLTDTDPGGEELSSAVVTIEDAASGEVLLSHELIGGDGKVDLSGIDPHEHPAITITATAVSRNGDPAWKDGVAPKIRIHWKADPQTLCIGANTQVDCAAAPIATLGIAARLAGEAAGEESELRLLRAPLCEGGPVPQPAPQPPSSPQQTMPAPPPPPPTASQAIDAIKLLLTCAKRALVLEDVVPVGGRVRLVGIADRRYRGQRVQIKLEASGEVVARPLVSADGAFEASAPLPPRSLRSSDRARYMAQIGGERSLDLKLARRMLVTSVSEANARVTIEGRVIPPLALGASARTIVVERQVSCSRSREVARTKPRADGSFSVSVAAPASEGGAIYRLQTKVRNNARNPKSFSTFTLPRAVDF